ncbi:MAG: ABC transporter substrate-binding protein [Pseudomonadota bacterium]|nr:ABC transporter substrate-binding protein [Pseudomonadota bacterium]
MPAASSFRSSSLTRRRLLLGVPALCLGAAVAHAQAPGLLAGQDKRRVTLAVGSRQALSYLPVALAGQLGFFDAEGLDVRLQEHGSGALAQQAMLAGAADVAGGGFERNCLLRLRGQASVAFVLLTRAPQMVLGVGAQALPDFRHVAQLRGRRVGVTGLATSTHWFAQRVLARGGVAAQEVEFIDLGHARDAVSAVREGRVDAIAHIDPFISLLEYYGEIRVLADTRSLHGTLQLFGGPMPGSSLYAPQAFVQAHPRTVQGLSNAVVRALTWLQTAGPGDIVRAVPEVYMNGDRAIYLSALDKSREAMSPDGMVSDEAAATAQRMVQQLSGSAGVGVCWGSVYTNEFARRARQALAGSAGRAG